MPRSSRISGNLGSGSRLPRIRGRRRGRKSAFPNRSSEKPYSSSCTTPIAIPRQPTKPVTEADLHPSQIQMVDLYSPLIKAEIFPVVIDQEVTISPLGTVQKIVAIRDERIAK